MDDWSAEKSVKILDKAVMKPKLAFDIIKDFMKSLTINKQREESGSLDWIKSMMLFQ